MTGAEPDVGRGREAWAGVAGVGAPAYDSGGFAPGNGGPNTLMTSGHGDDSGTDDS